MAGGGSLGIRIWTCASVCKALCCVFLFVCTSLLRSMLRRPSRGDVHTTVFVRSLSIPQHVEPTPPAGPPEERGVCIFVRSLPSDIHTAAALNTEKRRERMRYTQKPLDLASCGESTIRYPRSMIHNVTVTAFPSPTLRSGSAVAPPQRATPPQPAVGSGSAFSSFSPSAGSVGGRYCARLPNT